MLNYRKLTISDGPKTVNQAERSVSLIACTEQPTRVYSYEHGRCDEVILMSGIEIPESVPLLDTHSRYEISNVLGRVKEFKVEGDKLTGRAFFSGEEESAFKKVQEKTLDSVSIGYASRDAEWIPEGESKTLDGKVYEGPVLLSKRTAIKEVSLVPIAADDRAKIRSKGDDDMKLTKKEIEQIQTRERERIQEITAMGVRFNCEEICGRMVESGASVEHARKTIMDFVTKTAPATSGYRGPLDDSHLLRDEKDKKLDAIIDGLTLRAGVDLQKPAPGADEFRAVSLVDIARECLETNGIRTRGMSRHNIAREALKLRAAASFDFTNLLAGTANKVLRTSYQEAPGSYTEWVNQTSATDFKEMSRVQLSEAPNLDTIPEGMEYKYGKFGESKEVFQIYKYGKIFAITREAIVNDDLSAFTRVPRAFAMSAKRHINSAVYGILTANAAMSDGVALFHADHSNLAGSGNLDEAGLTAARLAMRKQTGLQSVLLNIAPKFLIVPAALETTGDVLLNSLSSLTDNKNEGVRNPFYKKLDLVVDAVLDASSASVWYLAASPASIDTIEVCFLDGKKEPYLETKQGWTVDGVEYKVRIEYGVKAIDWRGLYKTP